MANIGRLGIAYPVQKSDVGKDIRTWFLGESSYASACQVARETGGEVIEIEESGQFRRGWGVTQSPPCVNGRGPEELTRRLGEARAEMDRADLEWLSQGLSDEIELVVAALHRLARRSNRVAGEVAGELERLERQKQQPPEAGAEEERKP